MEYIKTTPKSCYPSQTSVKWNRVNKHKRLPFATKKACLFGFFELYSINGAFIAHRKFQGREPLKDDRITSEFLHIYFNMSTNLNVLKSKVVIKNSRELVL